MTSNRPIAVQFSDLRGFSSFTAEHGDEKAFQIAQQFVDRVGASVEPHGEDVSSKTYGDGVMTSFEDPSEAVRCAVTMQKTLCEEYCGGDDGHSVISAGIGLTWGSAIQTDGDLFGHSVNLAKRLADEAKGGQIVASSSVVDEANALEGYAFRDMGKRSLKGVGDHQLYEVIWRPEVARLETADDHMDIVLTEDHKLIVELGKLIQELESETISEEESGLARFVKTQLAKRLAKLLPTCVDWAQNRRGLGIEHAIKDVQAEIFKGKLTLTLGPKKRPLKFDPKDIDPRAAQAFVERLQRMKALASGSSD